MKFLDAFTLMAALLLAVNLAVCQEDSYQEGDEEASALKMMPTNEAETAALTPETRAFSDFCIESRDEVKKFLSELTHGAAANVFDAFFGTLGDFGVEIVQAEKDAVQKGAEIIKQKVQEPSEGVVSKSEIKENLDQNVETLSMIQSVSQAIKAVISSVIEAAQSQVFQRIALLRASFDAETLKEKLTEACDTVSGQLQKRLTSKFNSAKRELQSTATSGKESQDVINAIKGAKFETVKCVSTGRVVKVARFCDFLRVAGPTIYPLLGI